MQEPLSYRHRTITEDDLAFIRKLIADHPSLSRWKLSKKLCEAWNWVQANGAMRDMVCRSMMLMLHRRGLIELPELRRVQRNPMVDRKQIVPISVEHEPGRAQYRAVATYMGRCATWAEALRAGIENLGNPSFALVPIWY